MTIEDNVAKTLFIPLYMKAKESHRPQPFFHDPTACDLIKRVRFDFTAFDHAIHSQVGCALRANYFDQLAINFYRRHPQGIVVNVGCGLDARYQRINAQFQLPKTAYLYDLDLAEVINLRTTLMDSHPQNPTLSGSLFEPTWLETIRQQHGQPPILFITEGVFMYFDKECVAAAIRQMVAFFPQCDIAFDSSSTFMVKNGKRHDAIKHTETQFKLALDDPKEVESWHPSLTLQSVQRYTDFPQWQLIGRLNCWLMKLIPKMKNASRLLHYRSSPKINASTGLHQRPIPPKQ